MAVCDRGGIEEASGREEGMVHTTIDHIHIIIQDELCRYSTWPSDRGGMDGDGRSTPSGPEGEGNDDHRTNTFTDELPPSVPSELSYPSQSPLTRVLE